MGLLSETFSVNNSSSCLLIFALGNPHSLECRKGWKDWTSDPDQELSFSRGNNLDLHGWRSKGSHLFAETFRNARVHGGSSRHDNVAIEIFSNIDIALKDGLVSDFMESGHFLTDHHGFEEGFRASESLGRDCDDLTVRKFISFVVLMWAVIS